ncbi:MAG TPA: hypothetical protein V6C99_11170 [Oculatellaceae cyanobacterium]
MALITFSGMKPVATPYRPTNSSNSQKGGYRESGDHFAPRFGGVTAASSDAQLDKNALGKYIFSLYQHCSRGEYEQAVGKVQAWKDTHPDFIKRARKQGKETPAQQFLVGLMQFEEALLKKEYPTALNLLAALAAKQTVLDLQARRPGIIPKYSKKPYPENFESLLTTYLQQMYHSILTSKSSVAGAHFLQTIFRNTAGFTQQANTSWQREWALLFEDLGLTKLDQIISNQPSIPAGLNKLEELSEDEQKLHRECLAEAKGALLERLKKLVQKRAQEITEGVNTLPL